jgi:hypothetical protein
MYQCPRCTQPINAPDLAGQLVLCPACGEQFTMPGMPPPMIVMAPRKHIANEFGRAVSWGAGLYIGVVIAAITITVIIPLGILLVLGAIGTAVHEVAEATKEDETTQRQQPRPSRRVPVSPRPRPLPRRVPLEPEPTDAGPSLDESPEPFVATPDSEASDEPMPEAPKGFGYGGSGFGDALPMPLTAPPIKEDAVVISPEPPDDSASKDEPTRRVAGVAAPLRTWTITLPSGEVETLEARFVSISPKNVVSLRTEKGNRIYGPVDSLSSSDQDWLKEYLRPPKP